MDPSPYRVRRATVDDLGKLKPIWDSMGLGAQDLERRITEFQVAEDAEGRVFGAIGFQMANGQGRIHSESFSDFGAADTARQLFWERLQTLTTNHGIVRLWTLEQAPFWKKNGFVPADPANLKKLPAQWTAGDIPWLTLKLKDEDSMLSLDKELALFMESEKQRTARAFQQARAVKTFALLLAIAFAVFVVIAVLFLLKKNASMPGR